MMREIKHRGYYNFEGNALYLPDKRWIYGYYYFQEGKHYIKDIDNWRKSYEVEPKSVGDSVGLKDKNSKEIYEGDLIKDSDSDFIGEVIWDEDSLCFTTKFQGNDLWGFVPRNGKDNHCEVIGNIYEELLDEGKNTA